MWLLGLVIENTSFLLETESLIMSCCRNDPFIVIFNFFAFKNTLFIILLGQTLKIISRKACLWMVKLV